MITQKSLYAQLCHINYLDRCYKKAKAGTRRNMENTLFFFNKENELIELLTELKSGTYQPQPYRTYSIYEPKERIISIAAFRDRIIHHAIVGLLEPFYEKRFIANSYATRKNKGVHAAVKQASDYIKANLFYLKLDVSKYFQNISHPIQY